MKHLSCQLFFKFLVEVVNEMASKDVLNEMLYGDDFVLSGAIYGLMN